MLPLLKNYEIAKENIKLNNYSNIITLVLAGCSAKEGSINITAYWQKGIGKQIYDDSKEGTTIPLLTLEQILEQNNVGQRETVLKMDCEGCEYDVILSASDSILRRFSNILIEYHYGFNDIKESLANEGIVTLTAGFEVPSKLFPSNQLLSKKDRSISFYFHYL